MTHYDAETQAQFAEIRRVKEAAEERLLRIPAAGVGGKRTGDFAIIVYLAQEKPPSEVPPEEIIPSEIDSAKGDVQESGRFRALVTGKSDDDYIYRPVRGGSLIMPSSAQKTGTLGCVDSLHPEVIWDDLSQTTEGGRNLEVVRTRAPEVQRLIRFNKRVAAVSQRSGGPVIQKTQQSFLDPENPLPAKIEWRPLGECLDRMAVVLKKYASAALSSDVAQYGPRLIRLVGQTYAEVLAGLRASESVDSQWSMTNV